jgi:hypothetical protein
LWNNGKVADMPMEQYLDSYTFFTNCSNLFRRARSRYKSLNLCYNSQAPEDIFIHCTQSFF